MFMYFCFRQNNWKGGNKRGIPIPILWPTIAFTGNLNRIIVNQFRRMQFRTHFIKLVYVLLYNLQASSLSCKWKHFLIANNCFLSSWCMFFFSMETINFLFPVKYIINLIYTFFDRFFLYQFKNKWIQTNKLLKLIAKYKLK